MGKLSENHELKGLSIGWATRYDNLKNEIRERINSLLEGKEMDISKEDFHATITDRHSGETWVEKISKLKQYGFVAGGQEYRYSEMDLGCLAMMCDYIVNGEWKVS